MIDRRIFCISLGALSAASILPFELRAAQPNATPKESRHAVEPARDTMTQAQRDARIAWWNEARFGMFIHWGLYSEAAGYWNGKSAGHLGEWIMNTDKIPVADYKKLAATFNPTDFNANAWVSMAKAAGVKYMVITAKHHDGFAMFDSAASDFNIVKATSFKRDPIKELATACHQQGIKLGFYYSQDQDWTAPGGAVLRGGHWDTAQDGDFAEYVRTKVIPQLKELLSNYQSEDAPVEIWFDTPTKDMTPELAGEIVTLLNEHPSVLWNNRLGGGYGGDFQTPEQHIPPQGFPGKAWETCMTINDTWGFKKDDTNFKSTETLLRNLIDIASKGGNYLLNVGPDASGVIPEPEQQRMLAVGEWLQVNGEAIYDTYAGPFPNEHGSYSPTEKDKKGNPVWVPVWDWRATAKQGEVYISIFQWPGEKLTLPTMDVRVTKAYLLADPDHTALKVSEDEAGVTVRLPASAPDPIASVLVLQTQS